ncbi:MAG: zinc ribbon domain-containing protein [Dehalococcoidia bacterium]|nr:zinc ribbon domain-containing protein [Dehalococcoidia bacterium]
MDRLVRPLRHAAQCTGRTSPQTRVCGFGLPKAGRRYGHARPVRPFPCPAGATDNLHTVVGGKDWPGSPTRERSALPGTTLRNQAKFCSACGAVVVRPGVCPSCSAPVAPGARFCRGCGVRLSNDPTAAPVAPISRRPAAPRPPARPVGVRNGPFGRRRLVVGAGAVVLVGAVAGGILFVGGRGGGGDRAERTRQSGFRRN